MQVVINIIYIAPEIISHVALGNVVTMWHCDDITVPHCNNISHAGTDHSANFNLSIKLFLSTTTRMNKITPKKHLHDIII